MKTINKHMTKPFCILFSMLILMSVLVATPFTANAIAEQNTHGNAGNNCRWNLSNGGQLTISGEGAMYDYNAALDMWNKASVTSVIIEPGITRIGADAFAGCENLMYVSMPPSLASIGDRAFQNCPRLVSVKLPNNVTDIGDSVFQRCESLTTVEMFGGGITNVGNYMFCDCENLTTVILSGELTTIGQDAFANCSQDLTLYSSQDSYAAEYANAHWDICAFHVVDLDMVEGARG